MKNLGINLHNSWEFFSRNIIEIYIIENNIMQKNLDSGIIIIFLNLWSFSTF